MALPDGVLLLDLPSHDDARGAVVEAFRPSWLPGFPSAQWTLLRSRPNVVRGVHCHLRRTDFVVPAVGTVAVVVVDARPGSASFGLVERVVLDAAAPRALLVPVGVAHAFETTGEATVLTGLDTVWDPADEFGCSWSDPLLHGWFEATDPVLSERDSGAGSFDEMVAALDAAR